MARTPSKNVDWEQAERLYRLGQLSASEIAQIFKVDKSTITRAAIRNGWKQDLTEEVNRRTKAALLTPSMTAGKTVSDPVSATQLLQEEVDRAVNTNVTIIQTHRASVKSGREAVALLLSQLTDVALNREEIAALLDDEIKPEGENRTAAAIAERKKIALKKALGLPSHAAIVRDLSAALKSLVSVERQAYNIPDGASAPDNDTETLTDEELTSRIKAIEAEIAGTPGSEG